MENTSTNTNLYIFVESGDVDVVELSGYTTEEAISELNRLRTSYEKVQRYYSYELTDYYGNSIFVSHPTI